MKNVLKGLARFLGLEVQRLLPKPRQMVFDDTVNFDSALLKEFATRAAQFSASPALSESMRRLHLAGIFQERPSLSQSIVEVGDSQTLEVGLWRKESSDKAAPFVRQANRRHEWFYWANQEILAPKRTKWRVAFVGESVARGFLYDPHFNPALVLQKLLQSHLGANEIDVVDLAKSNLMMAELKTLAGQCLALKPDVVVIFAGNNWRAQISDSDIPYVETLLRADGVPALKSFLEARHEEDVARLVRQLSGLLEPKNIKLIWVVPDFNLADWSDPVSPAPLLSGQGNKHWRRLREKASAALRENNMALAESLTEEMTQIDGGTNSVPLRILAECSRVRGDASVTRRYLEMARDADAWNPAFSYSPRVRSAAQNVLRKAASLGDNIVVDLPEIISRHLNGGLPDRRVFLDYSHLTAEGINLAMAAVASQTIALLSSRKVAPEVLRSRAAVASAKVEGKASLLAAVHNAHFYQSYDIVQYWCGRALDFWPESAEIMKRFIDSQTRRAPAMACRSTLELFGLESQGALDYLLRGGKKRLDLTLSEAIAHSLREKGMEGGPQLAKIRNKEHSPRTGPKELTDFYYSSVVPRRWQDAWTSRSFPNNYGSHAMYASAFSPISTFVFFAEKVQPVRLKLTYRVPGASDPRAIIAIEVNGHSLAQAPARAAWRTLNITVRADCVLDGINEIAIIWPEGIRQPKALLDKAADTLVTGQLPYFHEVFGEIHSLCVSDPVLARAAAQDAAVDAELVS